MPDRVSTSILALGLAASAAAADLPHSFLKTYCVACHQGKTAAGGFDMQSFATPGSLRARPQAWSALAARVRNHEMPPRGAAAPPLDEREAFTAWVDGAVRKELCAAGIAPGRAPLRRLNRDEYAATIRDLLDIHMDIARVLPADGAGGEGFDNAAETLFLSPLHMEKYLELAAFAMDFAAKEFKSRQKVIAATPGVGFAEEDAARRNIEGFLPRAFRRPAAAGEVDQYLALFRAARKQGRPFEESAFFALRAALVSPDFLFRVEPANRGAAPRPLPDYALASRLSYFLWGSMPDEFLFDVAAAGQLHDREVLRTVVGRMLRNDRSLAFAQRFVEQWLRTRELGLDKTPDPQLFPQWAADEELRSDIRLQPVMFFRELLVQDLSLLNLLDSTGTIGTRHLARHFNLKLPLRANAQKQPHWVELPEGSNRGGLLGMPAVLMVSSHPYRTSPVLRGAWILDSLLGTPPPPPPPNVPALEEVKNGAAPESVRDRLRQHRANPACAGCHDRMDPLGFALENFDAFGRWREEDAGKPVDASGELPDGTKFSGPGGLKAALLARQDVFLRNLAGKMLGYALGRGLTPRDSCTVDAIAAEVKAGGYKAQSLIEAIVMSTAFRYQEAQP